jgi:hypothetical protein
MHLQPLDLAVVHESPMFRNRFINKLTRDRVIPTISASVS